jgi:hypothetical protein
MAICRWDGCKLVFEDAAKFQEHVNKHIQQEMQQPKMDNQNNNANAEMGAEDGPSLAKRVKMNNDGENRDSHMVLAEEMAMR